MTTATRPRFKELPGEYARLVELLPPRPIHDRAEYAEVVEMIDALAGFDLTEDQGDYLEALSRFVIDYEERHHPMQGRSPVERLRHLMEQRGMTRSDLGRVLGDASLATRILGGERRLNTRHIKALCEHFKCSADVFI